MGHGYNHIARSHSNKAQIRTTKHHSSKFFADVEPVSVRDLPINHVSTQTAQAHFEADEQRISKTRNYGRRPWVPLFGQYAMKEKKRIVLPKQWISGLPYSCIGTSKLTSLGRVIPFSEPSTRTSNAAITRGRLTLRH